MKAVIILKQHDGRFGNKLLHYHNAVQLSKYYECDIYTTQHTDYDHFNIKYLDDNIISDVERNKNITLSGKELMVLGYDSIKDYDYLILSPCLGELFYEFDYNAKSNLMFKNLPESTTENTMVGLHFRGTDFYMWNPKSILDFNYYKSSVDYCIGNYKDIIFTLYTDDRSLQSFKQTIEYLESAGKDFRLGPNTTSGNGYIDDFINLTLSDVIISSPSTFSICAGFLHKEKDIIHNREWVELQANQKDEFWLGLYNGGNSNYKIKIML